MLGAIFSLCFSSSDLYLSTSTAAAIFLDLHYFLSCFFAQTTLIIGDCNIVFFASALVHWHQYQTLHT